MADQYSVFNPTVDLNPYAAQIADIQRRQRMAQLLQQQGMEPLESQVVGNRVVPISPWQVLAKGLQAGMGAYQERQANQAAQDLQDQIQYNQRSQEAENAATQQAIAGRLFGERYTPPAKTPEVDYDHQLGGTPMPEKPSTLQVSPSATFAPRSIEEAGQQTRAADQLGEITPTATYRYDPKGALSIAMTQEGQQALQKNQMLASMLAQSMAKPDLTKFYGQIKPEDFTPESRAAFDRMVLSGQTPDYSILQKNPEKPQTTSLQHTTRTWYDKNGNEVKQDVTFNPATGEVKPIGAAYSGKPAEMPNKPLTESQANAAGFAARLAQADKVLSESTFKPSIITSAAGGLPFGVGNKAISPEQQSYEQAKRNFVTAQLRKESGAAISPSEFEVADKMYFPQPGDSEAVIKQKAETRKQAIKSMQIAAGIKDQAPIDFVSSSGMSNDPLGLRK